MNDIWRPSDIANPVGVALEGLIKHPLSARLLAPDLNQIVAASRHDSLGAKCRAALLVGLVDWERWSPANRCASGRVRLLDLARLPVAVAAHRHDAYRAV